MLGWTHFNSMPLAQNVNPTLVKKNIHTGIIFVFIKQ